MSSDAAKIDANKPANHTQDRLGFTSLYELAAWLVAVSGGFYLTQDMLTHQVLNEGLAIHPLSHVFFSLALISLSSRYFKLLPFFIRVYESKLTLLTTVSLAVFIVLRLVEAAVGGAFEVLTLIAGDAFGTTSYTSWPTALGILFLFGMATYCPKHAPLVLRVTSYLTFWSLVLLCMHQLLHSTGISQGDETIHLGVSGHSAFLLLCLAGIVLPRSAVWGTLFDQRTKLSNLLSAGFILAALGITVSVSAQMQFIEVLELSPIALLVSLLGVAPWARARELTALKRAGRLTPEGALTEVVIPSAMRPLPNIERTGLSKLFFDINFVKPLWTQDLLHATLIAGFAIGSILMQRTWEDSVVTFWPVNAVLGYWLILNPVARWARVLSYFYVIVLSVNLFMANPLAASAMLTAVDAMEAVMAILVSRTILGIFVKDRLVHITQFTIAKLFTSVGFSTMGLICSALLGGVLTEHFFGGSLLAKSWTWFSGSALGWYTIMPISLGILMEQHWGYPKLKSMLKPFWVVLPSLCVALWVGLDVLGHIHGAPMVLFIGLSTLGVFLSGLWQAGTLFASLTFILLFWWQLEPENLPIRSLPFFIIMFIIFTVIVGLFLLRMTQSRMERERDLIAIEGPSHLVTLDEAGNIVSCTDNLESLLGHKRADLIGKNLMDVSQVKAQNWQCIPSRPPIGRSIWACTPSNRGAIRSIEINMTVTSDRTMPFTYICAVIDRTETLRSEEARIAQIERSRAIILIQDKDWNIVYCSDGWCETMGYSREETTGQDLTAFLANDENRAHAKEVRDQRLSHLSAAIIDDTTIYAFCTKSGDIRLIKISGLSTSNNPEVITATLEDITELEAARLAKERALGQADAILSAGVTFFAVQDDQFNIQFMSQAFLDLLELPDITYWDKWSGSNVVLEGSDRQSMRNKLSRLPLGHRLHTTMQVTSNRSRRIIILNVSACWYLDDEGNRMLGSAYNDITPLREREAQLEEQAQLLTSQAETDPLTGILNRLGIDKRMEVDKTGHRAQVLAVYLLDLDFFKSVNDTYSHHVGDDLLFAVAKTLQACVAEGDVLGRLGGEEFFVATPWVTKEATLAFGERLRKAIETTIIKSDGHELSRTASIGATKLLRHEDFSTKLHLSDLALTDAKAEGRNCIVMADEAYSKKKRDEGAFITELDIVAGLEKREFVYYVQPIYNTSSHIIVGFEALIRWKKPDGTIIPPSMFVDRFHKIYYRPVYLETQQAMRRELLRELIGFPNTYVSWNFELEQFGDTNFVDTIIDTASELSKITCQHFVLEISERSMTTRMDMERIIPNLERLRRAGLKIALDDFGIEQSNIYRLTQLPIDIVKLDKSLIDRIETSEKDRATVRSISILLNKLKIVAIAEGVETHTQSRLLHHALIHNQQGYLHSRPMLPKKVQEEEQNIGYHPRFENETM